MAPKISSPKLEFICGSYSNTTRPARTERHRILRQCSCHTVWARLLIDKSSSWTNLGVFSSPTTIVTSFARPDSRLGKGYQRTVVLHSYSFVFSFRHQFKGHVTSPYTVAADRRSAVWQQFAEAVFISGHAWTELRQRGCVRGEVCCWDRRCVAATGIGCG